MKMKRIFKFELYNIGLKGELQILLCNCHYDVLSQIRYWQQNVKKELMDLNLNANYVVLVFCFLFSRSRSLTLFKGSGEKKNEQPEWL